VKFLLDHDVPAEVAHLLRYWEHNVTVLRTVLPVTASDEEVFGHACSQGLILISCNRDHFLTLARQTRDHPRLDHLDPTQNAPLGMRPSIGAAPTRWREGPPQQCELCLIFGLEKMSISRPSPLLEFSQRQK